MKMKRLLPAVLIALGFPALSAAEPAARVMPVMFDLVCAGAQTACALLSPSASGGFTLQSGQYLGPTGTAALPTFSFSLNPNTGLYRISANQWSLSSNGAANLWTDANGVVTAGTLGIGFASSGQGTADLIMVRGGSTGSLRIFSGTTPTQSGTTCGTGPTITGNNTLGSVTLGTTPGLPCTIVFNGTWTSAPKCFLDAEVLTTATTTVRATGITTTQFVITSTAALVATDKISWICASN